MLSSWQPVKRMHSERGRWARPAGRLQLSGHSGVVGRGGPLPHRRLTPLSPAPASRARSAAIHAAAAGAAVLLKVAAVDVPKLHMWETGIMRITRHPQVGPCCACRGWREFCSCFCGLRKRACLRGGTGHRTLLAGPRARAAGGAGRGSTCLLRPCSTIGLFMALTPLVRPARFP
jgi:hypothetical protein